MEEITVIKPKKRIRSLDFQEILRYRELFLTFAWRDIRVRYKQTIIGGAWAIVQPLLTMVVFSFFFGKIAQIPSDGVPYPIFSYSGLLLWIFFSNSISNASTSLVGNRALVSKVYFPRAIIPISSTIVMFLDYLIASIVMLLLMVYYRIPFTFSLLLVPLLLLMTWVLANGIGLLLAAINVKYRDVRFALPFFIQLLIFITPVIYPVSVSGKYRWVIALNPMSGLIEAHRAALLGHQAINYPLLIPSVIFTILIFIIGALYFKNVERFFADII